MKIKLKNQLISLKKLRAVWKERYRSHSAGTRVAASPSRTN